MTSPNILFVTHRVPYPPDKGDRIRTYHLLKFLAQQGKVYLASLADEPVPAATLEVLNQYCERITIASLDSLRWARGVASFLRGGTISEGVFHSPGLTRTLRRWGAEFEFRCLMASSSSVASYLRLPELRRVPAVVDLIDVDSQKWFDYAEQSTPPKSWLYRSEGRRLRQAEINIAGWAQASTLVSAGEVALFRGFCCSGRVETVRNGVDLDYFQPMTSTERESGCVFVGALDYRPNVDAACWFCEQVWPDIRARKPESRFRIVGRQPTRAVQDLARIPGVEVVGQVADVRPYVSSSAVVVAPLRIARGLQNKVLEALAMGKAIVSSPSALAGFQQETPLPAISARQPAEWVEAICHLLEDENARHERGRAGRDYAETYHDWNTCLEPMGHLLGLREGVLLEAGTRS